jgi:hypothetical protein
MIVNDDRRKVRKYLLYVLDFILHLLVVSLDADSFVVDYTGDAGRNLFLGPAFCLGSTTELGVVSLCREPVKKDAFRASFLLSSHRPVVPPRDGHGGRHRFVATLGAHDLDIFPEFGEVDILVFTGKTGNVHALCARRPRAGNYKDVAGGKVFARCP